jgi:AcrR family transcriptional regulator
MARQDHLSADDWITAGFRALSAGGEGALRAEAIARALKVSKGSFYWHFKDVADLKARMLGHWQERATAQVIQEIEGSDADARARMALLIQAATAYPSEVYGGRGAEVAIREWARHDAAAAQSVRLVDRARMAYLVDLLTASGVPLAEAPSAARLFYGAYLGLMLLDLGTPGPTAQDLTELFNRLAGGRHATRA